MPKLADYEELDLTGFQIDAFEYAPERLNASYGGGYGDVAVVGPGRWGWDISAEVLTDADGYNDLVNSKRSMEYYWDFFYRFTSGGGDIFKIYWRGKYWHVRFSKEAKYAGEVFTSDLFSGEVIRLEHARVPNLVYNDDGSIFTPNDLDAEFWYQITSASSVAAIPDLSTNNNDLVSEAPFPTLTTNGTVSVIRWDGTDDNPLVSANGSIVVTHVYIVCCATAATFDASPLRGLISGKTLGMLVSEASTTKWTDLSYGANFEYKKNGTAYADNNAQAPMSGTLAVVECKFPSTIGIDDYLQIGKDREFTSPTRFWKGDVAMVIGINNASLTSTQEYMLRRFCAQECGGITVVA